MQINNYLVRAEQKVRTVMEVINRNKDGIALVVDDRGKLIGTVTDGDIRRFMLSGRSFEEQCKEVMYDRPVKAVAGAKRSDLIKMFNAHRIRNIPIVDEHGSPLKVVNVGELISKGNNKSYAVIMAGGEGIRLRPLTEHTPKPMLKVGGTPVLEQIVNNLKEVGFDDIFISVNYLGNVIEDHFKDGSRFGVNIRYLREEKKLGTAGSLSLLAKQAPEVKQPYLILNGDVVTSVGFDRFIEFHKQCRSVMSIAAIDYHMRIPFGVLKIAGHHVLGVEEKPTHQFLCNAGIYVIEPEIIHLVPENSYFDMTDLLRSVVEKGLPISAFPVHEHWIDIGKKEDLKWIQENFPAYRNSKQEKPSR